MKIKIPQSFIYEFAERLLREVGIDSKIIKADLTNFIYEAGERNWEEYENDYGDIFYFIEFDLD